MDITRRDFLKWSGAAGAGLFVASLGFDLGPIKAYASANPPEFAYETTTICCYCAVGCGLIVGTKDEEPYVTHVEGNADHPINEGALCSKGAAMSQLRTVDGALNPRRLTTPMRRAAGGTDWQPISWNTAINEIAGLIKGTRDDLENPVPTVPEENRCAAIASFGGAAHDNEECYLLVKLLRALGLVYIEHQARI